MVFRIIKNLRHFSPFWAIIKLNISLSELDISMPAFTSKRSTLLMAHKSQRDRCYIRNCQLKVEKQDNKIIGNKKGG
jgi:hypothetical protein